MMNRFKNTEFENHPWVTENRVECACGCGRFLPIGRRPNQKYMTPDCAGSTRRQSRPDTEKENFEKMMKDEGTLTEQIHRLRKYVKNLEFKIIHNKHRYANTLEALKRKKAAIKAKEEDILEREKQHLPTVWDATELPQ